MNQNDKSGLWFEGRQLSLYQKCIDERDLREGEVYFTVSYLDDDMCLPELKPVTFIGRHLAGEDSAGLLHFQDYDSYRQGVRWPDIHNNVTGVQAVIFSINSGESTDVCDYEAALESLLKCSLRRRVLLQPPDVL